MKFLIRDEYNIRMIIVIIALIILVIPVLMTLPAFFNVFDFSDKGQIGDTIGGLTSPFMSGLAATLIYIAFKEQVKANRNFMNIEERKIISEQIDYVRNYDIVREVLQFNQLIGKIGFNKSNEFEYVCGRIKIIMSDIEDLEKQINNFGGNNDIFKTKFETIFKEIYISQLFDLSTNFHAEQKIKPEYVELVNEVTDKKNKLIETIAK